MTSSTFEKKKKRSVWTLFSHRRRTRLSELRGSRFHGWRGEDSDQTGDRLPVLVP
jgi:hypothetical protein